MLTPSARATSGGTEKVSLQAKATSEPKSELQDGAPACKSHVGINETYLGEKKNKSQRGQKVKSVQSARHLFGK